MWQPVLAVAVGPNPTPAGVLKLGGTLAKTFRLSGAAGRGQGEVSGGGAAWEALVCWYLNLCLIGTNSVAIKKQAHVPACIKDALTISYRSVTANTESDLVCITFPEDLKQPKKELTVGALMEHVELVADDMFSHLRVSIVQCKTNWNDNSQIPMMWDMLYNAKDFKDKRISKGHNQFFIEHLDHFSYAFVTVPTVSLAKLKPNSVAVRRVAELSGGNYWGLPGSAGIAKSLDEIFGIARIGPNSGRNVRGSLKAALPRLRTEYSYFDI